MKVFIDADGCPVVDIAVSLCQTFSVSCLLFCDTAHQITRPNVQTVVCDKGADSVDFVLVNRLQKGDIVITQDYGLASMALAKGAYVLHQDGWQYTSFNIDALLFQRHESRKFRATGGRIKGPSKRKPEQDKAFAQTLQILLQQAVQG